MTRTSRFQLSGLTCGACEKIITKKLKTIEGVINVQVSAQNGIASIFAPQPIDQEEVENALQGTHYKVVNNL